MSGKGEPKENRIRINEHELKFTIVLQQQWEISHRYAMFASPVAYSSTSEASSLDRLRSGQGDCRSNVTFWRSE